jgi:hypothetical protein
MVPAIEAKKKALADKLVALNPGFTIYEEDFEEIAGEDECSVEEARVRNRQVELSDADGFITIYDDCIEVSAPDPDGGREDRAGFVRYLEYLALLEKEGDYIVYDEDLERIIHPSEELKTLSDGRSQPGGTYQIDLKPWWRFW